jgi:Family of unknown function (DUF6151)
VAEIHLQCYCGSVEGIASGVTADSGIRVVCCCDDCQTFAHYLDREDVILDEYGGTDIFQMPMSHLKITEGIEKIRCVRLSQKGMFRWYTACCKTPIGNTMSSSVPFIGLIHNFVKDPGICEKNFGPVLGYIQTKFAKHALPSRLNQSAFPIGIITRWLSKVILWKLQGLNKPSSFFDSSGKPISVPHILSSTIEN